ncbi:hypothetical protein BDV23DRAFT_157234 [Aspergillus alliaceus]|uniref:Uncharacterized protein n=1 Tax=Petromyces alliaceus TaxID=209559 RepID=A0A5N7C726_PETAA|nr:hypothetical protein BDV23DRAFT_157234 [Aspergillus alliaceus]
MEQDTQQCASSCRCRSMNHFISRSPFMAILVGFPLDFFGNTSHHVTELPIS